MEKTVQNAIESLTYQSKKFPKEEFRIISENKEQAIPYLLDAIEKAIQEKEDLDVEYQLHFYGLFLLGQFQEKSSFPKIMELASLPGETLDDLIGDGVTGGLSDVLYNTYDGDRTLLENAIKNPAVDDFARSSMLDVLGQLYLDGRLPKKEFQDFIREIVYGEEEIGEYIYTAFALMICDCHFVDMLPEIKRLYEDARVEEESIGEYDECVDNIFSYKHDEKFCITPMNAANMLRTWAMFEDEPKKKLDENVLKKTLRMVENEYNRQTHKIKIGRNDPCPCGSGKKYKKCCLNKPKTAVDLIESEQERQKWLKNYPPSAGAREEGKVYLEDFFDLESIAIDKMVYLALHHRSIPLWRREEAETVENRRREYLKEAFAKFSEKVEKEEIATFREYDEKYLIHYPSEEWMHILSDLLKKNGEQELYKEVAAWCKKMG